MGVNKTWCLLNRVSKQEFYRKVDIETHIKDVTRNHLSDKGYISALATFDNFRKTLTPLSRRRRILNLWAYIREHHPKVLMTLTLKEFRVRKGRQSPYSRRIAHHLYPIGARNA